MKKMFTRLDNAICKNYKKREQNMEEVRNLLIEKYPKERQDSLEKLYGIFSKHCYEIVKYGFYINALLVSDAKDYRGLRLDIGRVKYELPGLVLLDRFEILALLCITHFVALLLADSLWLFGFTTVAVSYCVRSLLSRYSDLNV